MTEPTADDLARWAALAEAATPGPWSADDEHGNMPGATPAWCVSRMDGDDGRYLGDLAYTVGAKEQADAHFIAAARTAVPRLLALVAAQAEQIAELRDGMFGWRKHCYDAWVERDASEAKIAQVRAACDEADRRGLGTDHVRAALDGYEGCSHHGRHVCPGEATP